jgi:RND family efflux transporter MFP subunit
MEIPMFSTKHYLVIAGAALLAGCGGEKKGPAEAKETPAVSVRTVRAEQGVMPVVYQATGTVRARTTAVLSARVMGYLKEVRAQAGEAVKAGQVIAVVDAREIETSVKQAEAGLNEAKMVAPEVENAIAAAKSQLALAESTYKRMKPLYEDKSITPQEFDEVSAKRDMAAANLKMAQARQRQLEARIQQATEAVEQARTQSGYLTVTAPFAGVVVERKAEPGMLASPGQPIVVVEQSGAYRLEAAIEEARLKDIRVGTRAKVKLDALETGYETQVSEIVPAMEPGSRTFTAKLNLPAGPTVRSGMFGRASFRLGERQAVQIAEGALRRIGQLEQVFVIEQGVARARLVTTGARADGKVEVLSGLGGGETLAVEAPAELGDGSRVEVIR